MTTAERAMRKQSRKRTEPGPRSWEEINQRLACLGEMERQIRGLRDQFEQKVAVLKQQWLEASQPLVGEKKRFEDEMECFYWAHRDEVFAGGRKSVEMAFGRLGSRSSRRVVVEEPAAAEQWLAGNGFGRYLRVRTEIDREALRSALFHPGQPGGQAGGSGEGSAESRTLLRCPGIRLQESEEFWYEVDLTRWGSSPQAGTDSDAGRNGSPLETSKQRHQPAPG